mmetsp:Transcript_53044/g.148896  ORF Transcript_53044/g.148896 Transcript_53044/m.148896 type:complete len:226 (-) Transcript_53044:577-1254(-)
MGSCGVLARPPQAHRHLHAGGMRSRLRRCDGESACILPALRRHRLGDVHDVQVVASARLLVVAHRVRGAPLQVQRLLRCRLQQSLQDPVEPPVHVAQRQVVRPAPERHLDLHSDVVHRPEDEDDEKCVDGRLHRRHARCADQGHGDRCEERKHHPSHLGVGEREGSSGELPCVDHVNDADGQLLKRARQDRRGDVNDAGPRAVDDEPLHPLQQHILLSAGFAEVP